jgi:hypothetical protein
MRRFSCIVLSLMRHLYRLFESVHITSGSGLVRCKSCVRVDLIAAAALNLFARVYVSEASTLRVIFLHLVED